MFELAEELQRLEDDNDLRVVVLRGAGREAFSGGFDIERIENDGAYVNNSFLSPIAYAADIIERFPRPVIAQIYGFCVGGALELATACDFRLAALDARLGITPAKLGIVYLPEPVRRFVDLVGPACAKDLFITGRLISGERAHQIGLVTEAAPADELDALVAKYVDEIRQNAPLSVRAAKETVYRLTTFPRLTEDETRYFYGLRRKSLDSADLREGREAFAQRRKPVFRGE
jgi:enoyl-CoA hydratase/carnithine racemase